MRVITGSARGRKLMAPEGLATRPTTDKMKESIFSAIQFEVPGARVLDLFAGSGQMGIEALSRGARFATFIDHDSVSQEIIRKNLISTGFLPQAQLSNMDAFQFLSHTKDRFTLAFIDPPYQKGLALEALPLLAPILLDGAIAAFETERGLVLPKEVAGLIWHREYFFGQTKMTTYQKKGEMI